MVSLSEVETAMKAPLEIVLNRWYPTPFLKWLYLTNLRQLAEANPTTLPQPDRKDVSSPEKLPKKAYLSALLLLVLHDKELGRRLFETLPRPTRDVLAILTWSRQANVAALERDLGFQVVFPNPEERRRFYEPFFVPPEHGFILIQRDPPDRWGGYYGHSTQPPNTKDFAVSLPREVRARFRTFVPPQPGYDLLPLADLPADAGTRYDCASKAIADLRLVAEFIEQGHLKYTKAERVAMPSLRAILQMTGGPEFFPSSDDTDLALLRTRLLSDGAALVGTKGRAELLARPDAPEPARSVFLKALADAPFLHEDLLGHLDNSQNRGCRYHPAAVANLTAFFARLPSAQWISWDNIATYHTLREEVPSLFVPETNGPYANVRIDADPWSRRTFAGGEAALDLLGVPLLKGYAFLLAAFGMAEIAYDLPKSPTYRCPKKPYLTPFDGLRYVRLTPWGEFVLGQRKAYEIGGAPATRSVVVLDEDRLLATCRNPDALTELALGRFLERLVPGRYGLTPKSLLGGCTSRADVEERIRLFRRVVSDRPPAIWEAFFAKTLARIAPLKPESDYLVLKLDADEELRRHLATDPILRELALKVEGLRIAVRRGDLKKLTKRLEQFGYLSPIG